MYSLSWPKMFSNNNVTTALLDEKAAIKSNLHLLLNSEGNSLFGDPFYGTDLRKVLFQQPNNVIVDLIIDEIYTSICTYIPQLYVGRNDITISSDKIDLYATINATYRLDNTSDLYVINLTNNIQEV